MMSGGSPPDLQSMIQDPNLVNAAQQLASENPELLENLRGAVGGQEGAGQQGRTEDIDE